MLAPDNLLGIAGLTPGGLGIWVLVASVIVAYFRIWPAMKKAGIDGNDALFNRMRLEMERMADKIETLERRVEELESNERGHLAELIELRAGRDAEGRVKQLAQTIISGERVAAKTKEAEVK